MFRAARTFDRRFPSARAGTAPTVGVLLLDGVDDYVTVASNAAMMPASNKLTAVGFVYLQSLPADTAAIGLYAKADYGVSSSYGLRVGASDFGDRLIGCIDTLASEVFANASSAKGGRYSAPPTGAWIQVAFIFDGAAAGNAKATLYLNSGPLDKTAYTGTQPSTIVASTSALEYGAIKTSGTRGSFGNMYLSDWCFYDRALSESELRSHMTGSAPIDFILRWPFTTNANDTKIPLSGTFGGGAAVQLGLSHTTYTTTKRLHCIGDSLSRGQEPDWSGTYRAGYRRHLFKALATLGIAMRGVGGNPTNEGPTNEHDGVNGRIISDMFATCTGSAALTPDVVVFMAGTNNCRSGTTAAVAIADYDTAMTNIYTGQSPYCIIVAPPPFLFAETPINQEMIVGLNSYVKNTLGPVQAAIPRSVYAYDPNWLGTDISSDNVHLNDTGYARLGNGLATLVQTTPSQPTAPAVTHRATLRAAASVTALWSGRKYPTITSSKVSSWLDVHADDAGTGSFTASQGTAAARPLANGAGIIFLAGQDDATGDVLTLSAGTIVSNHNAFTSGILYRPIYDPKLDLSGAHAFYSLQDETGQWFGANLRTLDAGVSYRLYFWRSGDTFSHSVPWTHSTAAVKKIIIQYDGSTWSCSIDGSAQTVATDAIGPFYGDTSTIGGILFSGTLYGALGGVIRELVICNSSSAATATAVNTYLETAKPNGY